MVQVMGEYSEQPRGLSMLLIAVNTRCIDRWIRANPNTVCPFRYARMRQDAPCDFEAAQTTQNQRWSACTAVGETRRSKGFTRLGL